MAQDDVFKSSWATIPVTVDGVADEWKRPFNLYDGSTGLQFSIGNDSANLYLCFTANDESKARKIMRTGWQIELSSKEKNKKVTAAIIFPQRQMTGFENKERTEHKFDWKKKTNFEGLVGTYKMQFLQITATGFRTKNGLLPAMDTTGIQTSIGSDSVLGVVYEITIPMQALFDANFIQLNEQLTLNVKVHGLEAPAGSGGNAGGNHGNWGGNGDRRMAGEGMNGQGMGGGMNGYDNANRLGGQMPHSDFGDENGDAGNNMAERAAMYETASFKQKFRLTNK